MPELPEVEIVCRNLSKMIEPGSRIRRWKFFRPDLRFVIPQAELKKLVDRPLIRIERRAKYILFRFKDHILISHLGMTGAWRREKDGWGIRKHDHLAFYIGSDVFVFEDPRRFGFIETIKAEELEMRFHNLGVEPLDKINHEALFSAFKVLKAPIKTALMNQKLLVGVGNIYASEVLFRTGVNPLKSCSKLSYDTYKLIFTEVKLVLSQAIEAGGSTISDYRNSYGEKGSYQNHFFVYGRKNEACVKCLTLIKSVFQAGRSTFWCPKCQKK